MTKDKVHNCPNCQTRMIDTLNYNPWWKKCPDCNQFLFTYEPMPHQERYHRDPAKFKMFAGGYGSSKTVTVSAEFVMLALSTPNGVGLVGAATYPQLERTSKKQVLEMIPEEFIAKKLNQKDNVMTLNNGYEIMFRSFDDEQKLRSLNLCHVVIEEANGTDFSIFTQLQTRLRHSATDDHKILMATNPDQGWVRSEILLKSKFIYGATEKYHRKLDEINPNISTHISRSDQNIYLPKDFIDSVKVGKPSWWIEKFIYGSFSFSEGAVYPNIQKNIIDMSPDEVRHNVRTKGWKVTSGADYGLQDPTVFLLVAVDPVDGIAYVYDAYAKRQLPVPHHAREMNRMLEHVPHGGLKGLIGDPSGKRRNINDRRSIFDHYAEYGLLFEPGDNRIDAGIMKVFSYFEMGKLKILSHLVDVIEELTNYHYKPTDMDERPSEKPADGEDHFCFVAGTMISTENGDVPIESIKVGDYVHTRLGLKRVYDSMKTGYNQEVYEVEFSNGKKLTATGNHPVWVKGKGFRSVDTLRYYDTINVLQDWEELQCHSNESNGTEKHGQNTHTKPITKVIQRGYTGRFGSFITGLYRKAITFTTSTMIQITTALKTLKSSKVENTKATTWVYDFRTKKNWKEQESIWQQYDQWQQNGIVQKKDENGIERMASNPMRNENFKNIHVNDAEISTLQEMPETISSAQMRASLQTDERVALTMWREYVASAELNSLSTNTPKKTPVQEDVRVLKVTKLEAGHDVYGVSVEDAHEYYANGVLVSNCDTLRYIVQTFPDSPDLLKSITYGFDDFRQVSSEEHLPFELRSDTQDYAPSSPDDWYSTYY